jgi:hypothetical protein
MKKIAFHLLFEKESIFLEKFIWQETAVLSCIGQALQQKEPKLLWLVLWLVPGERGLAFRNSLEWQQQNFIQRES